jgi:hypothetical protein
MTVSYSMFGEVCGCGKSNVSTLEDISTVGQSF